MKTFMIFLSSITVFTEILGLHSYAWADVSTFLSGVTSSVAALGAQSAEGQSPNGIMAFGPPFLLMFGVIYFLILRPQQKKLKEQQEMLAQLQIGTEVLTSSGFLGKIIHLSPKVVTLEVSEGVSLKFLRSQITQVLKISIEEFMREPEKSQKA